LTCYLAFQHRFNKQEADRGYTKFIDLKWLTTGNEQSGPFIVDDSFKIIAIVRLIEDPTGVLWHNFIE
jgi:ubiquitin carboxyl-terminal hydrolase 7